MQNVPRKEDLRIEFKSDRQGYPDDALVDEIVGMTNTEGGVLYLGVEDDGEATGVHKKHLDPIGLSALIANHTRPSISVRAEIIQAGGISIMMIDVPKSYTVVATASGKILKRRLKADGSPEVIPMYPYEISTRLSDLRKLDFSAQAVQDASLDDFDPNQMARLRTTIQNRDGDRRLLALSDRELEQALQLIVFAGGVCYPTLAGMLILGKEESLKRFVPTMQAGFQVLQGTKVVLNETFHKPILEVLELFYEYLKPWNPEKELEYGLFRIPIPVFSKSAFREGIVNAFVHRDYSILGAVRIEISDEGMTISNPGGFIDGVTLENLLTVEPYGRNPALSDALKRIGLAERTGRGIDRIFEGAITFGRPWPDYSETTARNVVLFMPRAKADESFIRMLADEQARLGRTLSINALLVLSAIKTERKVGIGFLQMVTHIPFGRINSVIEELVENGLVEETGAGRRRQFILSRKVYGASGKLKEYTRQKGMDKGRFPEMIMTLAAQQEGIVSKKDAVDLLHIPAGQAYLLLRKLCDEKKMILVQGGRYAKYRLSQ